MAAVIQQQQQRPVLQPAMPVLQPAMQKRRSNAIAIVDPTTNKAIDVLAAKTASEATAVATAAPVRISSTIIIEAPPEVKKRNIKYIWWLFVAHNFLKDPTMTNHKL